MYFLSRDDWHAYSPSRLRFGRRNYDYWLPCIGTNSLCWPGISVLLDFLRHSINSECLVYSFYNRYLQLPTFNPWNSHLSAGHDVMAFPYGVIMYLAYLPLTALGWLADQELSTAWFTKLGFSLTSLLFDYGLLVGIAVVARQYSPKLLLISYWCSPLVIYILYWHGQLDILPVCLLIWGVSILQRRLTTAAAVIIAFAISAKFSMVVALPFIAIYLYRNRRYVLRLLLLFPSQC